MHLNESIKAFKSDLKKYSNCVCMYSRNIHNINDVFEEFITVFNTFPMIKNATRLI